ncbi:MAG: hypothetical protein EZS28_026682, partial [Streblomastix strix]
MAYILSGSILSIDGQCQFIDCYAYSGGGGIYARIYYSGRLIIQEDCLFKGCKSLAGGGAFVETEYQGDVQLNKVTFDNCSASDSGGGIYCSINNQAKISINNIIINNCRAPNGGGIYIDANFPSQFQFIIDDVLIKECQAISNQSIDYPTGFGGGIFLAGEEDYDPSSNDLDFRGMKIYNNSATIGGQINRMERLGKGAFGEVRKAIHKQNGQIVAWKEMSYYSDEEKELVNKERENLKNAYDEIKLNFPNQLIRMVQPLGFFLSDENDMAYIVMEYCEKGDLR